MIRTGDLVRKVLAVLLLVWEPVTSALAVSGLVARVGNRPVVVALLTLRVLVVGVGIGAGMSLWQDRPGAIVLARWAIALSLAAAIATSLFRTWPAVLPFGMAGTAFTVLIVWNLAWLVWAFRQEA